MNHALGTPFSGSYAALWMLLTIYGFMHVVALSVASLLAIVLPARYRSGVYFGLSSLAFLASVIVLNPMKIGAVHLFTIFLGSLVLIALDYAWRANRRRRNEALSA